MKLPVSSQVRVKVLELRRSHSLSAVAAQTGIPLGTVKTICYRSGAFKDNLKHRELFALPPMQASESTALELPAIPPQSAVTGDKDIDAVLWLRNVIKIGHVALIEKAMEAAKRIKTPLKELEDRYMKLLVSKNPGNWKVAFESVGFADLESLATRSIKKLTLQHEATARFGIEPYAHTPAEQFCIDALNGLKSGADSYNFDNAQADERFQAHPGLMPHTLSDCLRELAYWNDLYRLRNSIDGYGDSGREAYARECFAFRSLAHIKPKSKPEAIAVLRYLTDSERMDDDESNGILINRDCPLAVWLLS